MGILVKIVGAIWSLIGFANLVMMPWNEVTDGVLLFGVMFNMLLFVIPGLIVYGVGSGIGKSKATNIVPEKRLPAEGPRKPRVEERLDRLKALKEKAIINESVYESRRNEILREL